MRVFPEANYSEKSKPCPICGTKENKPVVLVGIAGSENGRIMEAVQVHLECLDLYYYPPEPEIDKAGIIAQRIELKAGGANNDEEKDNR